MLAIHPDLAIEVVDALDHFPWWFRAYYNSYEIPLKYWPALWGWIENIQHTHRSTAPGWLFRRAARALSQFLQAVDPDIVIVTEVGICELVAMVKQSTEACFHLVAVPPGVDIDRAWAQPGVGLYSVAPGEAAAKLRALSVPDAKILACGVPIDPLFASLPDKTTARERLQIERSVPLVVVEFGGTGYGNPRRIVEELKKLQRPVQVVFISGKNQSLEMELLRLCAGRSHFRVLGWVDSIHEWMAAADLLVGKPGGITMMEAINSGLPLLAFDPLPGEERRNCDVVEKWGVGYWVKSFQDLAPTIARLLANREELQCLRKRAVALARPYAAQEATEAILKLCVRVAAPTRERLPGTSQARAIGRHSGGD
jgi:processive 1,2-diacylglycerol beta-glucosyltransferase